MPTKTFFAAAFLLAGAAFFGGALAGCPGSLDDPSRFTGDGGSNCGDVPATIFTASCALGGCHTTADNAAAGNLDLQAPNIGTRLLNKKSTGNPSIFLIDGSNPEQSALYTKLKSPPPFGSRMPLGSKLTDAQIQCVHDWVVQQASGSGPTDSGSSSDTGGGSDTGSGTMDAGGDGAASD